MTVIPENSTVLCELVNKPIQNADEAGIVFEKEDLPIYRIISVSPDVEEFHVDDEIVCDSTGTKLNVPNKGVQYLFNVEHIACKIKGEN